MSLPLFLVDSFTAHPFAGNPAGVCLLSGELPDATLQEIAREMNQAETAFLLTRPDGFGLRWFTPETEVDLCGHATLASAHVLWETAGAPADREIRFHTRSGVLTAHREGTAILLDFPATPAEPGPIPAGLAEALGAPPVFTGKTIFDLFVELESESVVCGLTPDLGALGATGARGIIVTARSAAGPQDFVSRFFAPACGIPEDPVTGSAHCALGPYWQARLGKDELLGYQASRRGGFVRVRCRGERVHLIGEAVTVVAGELRV